jgi:hypothetical protein
MEKIAPLARPEAPSAPPPPFNLAGSLLLACLVTALVAIGGGLLARFQPLWRPGFLTAACFLVAVEASLVRYRMLRGQHLEVGALSYLAAELFSLAVLMRAAASLGAGLDSAPEQLALWVRSPLDALDTPFLLCFALGAAVALVVRGGLRELAELDPRHDVLWGGKGLEADFYRAETEQRERESLTRIGAGLAWGAVAALVALTGQVLSFERLGAPPLPLAPASGLAGIAYLVCGVLLYSRARLGLLRSRWQRDDALIEAAVPARWRRASVALVLAVAIVGLALPSGYGAELLGVAQGGMIAVLNVLSLLALFFGAIAIGVLGLALTVPALILALLTGGGAPAPPVPAVVPTPVRPPPPPPPVDPPIAPGVIFWACVLILALYALWTVLRRQAWAVALAARVRSGLLAPLLGWLGRLWGSLSGYALAVGEAVAERLRRPPPPPARPARPRLSRLDPAGLVRYFYSSALEWARRGGMGRRDTETPYEYGARLRSRIPDSADEVDALTDAYVTAAYAPRTPSDEDARRARGVWARLKRALRALRGEGR